MLMTYQPGKHLIATLFSEKKELLSEYQNFQFLVNKIIDSHDLQKLGEVYHNFEPAGFTAVICLSESHLSIHTWPEHGRVNVDIYLSNFMRNNDNTVDNIYQLLKEYFNATVTLEQSIIR